MSPFVFAENMPAGILVERHISVSGAAILTGYNPQYLRRLLRQKRLMGIKVGQQWFIELDALQAYVEWSQETDDMRRGPHGIPITELDS